MQSARGSGIKFGLDPTRDLIRRLGNPGGKIGFLHVAGTNGKGSVCSMLDSALRLQGDARVGLFTSPHLVTFRERIRIGGIPVSEEQVAESTSRLRPLCKDLQPTCFEIITALALDCFQQAGCDWVAWETGLGGRLDSTNAVRPVVTGITRIGLDHREFLGNTLGEIAREKAGIFKPGVPAWSVAQEPEVEEALVSVAASVGAPLQFVRPPFTSRCLRLRGSHQLENAALATAMLHVAKPDMSLSILESGVAGAEWPGRFQIVRPGLVLDGAHNPDAARVLAETWRSEFGTAKACVILGVMKDKDIHGIWKHLQPIAAEVISVAGSVDRWMTGHNLVSVVGGYSQPDVPLALEAAKMTNHPILVTGSLFLVGEVMAFLENTIPDWPGP